MTTAAYREWVASGEPYTPCRPVREFVDLLRSAGYTVFHKGNSSHMMADPPEDHTPFSATGWPIPSKRWIGHALDIMPSGPGNLDLLAERIIADKRLNVDGTQWIKYINWTDSAGKTWHYSWQPTFARSSSTDTGHVHISARSDMDTSDVVSRSGYLGDLMATQFSADDVTVLRSAALAVLQYAGRGIGDNDETPADNKPVLEFLDEIWRTTRLLATEVADLKTLIANLPTATGGPTVDEIKKATVDEFRDRL
jgi:hypothetical protein